MEGMWAFALVDIDKQEKSSAEIGLEKSFSRWETNEAYFFGSRTKIFSNSGQD